jgi:hypothetical protein
LQWKILVYYMAIHIIWYIFPVLVCCTKKNLTWTRMQFCRYHQLRSKTCLFHRKSQKNCDHNIDPWFGKGSQFWLVISKN